MNRHGAPRVCLCQLIKGSPRSGAQLSVEVKEIGHWLPLEVKDIN